MSKGLPSILPYKQDSLQELVLIKTNIAGFFFDGFLSIDHSYKTTITSHPVQTGANISDHAYNEPAELRIVIKMSDAKEDIVGGQFAGIAYTRSVGAFNILKQLNEQRMAFQVHTRLATYQNMMISGISISDDLDNLYGLEASVDLQQILVASTKTVKISKRVQTTASTSVGSKNAKKIDSSLLYMWAQSLGFDVS